jgi:hypothetical protein
MLLTITTTHNPATDLGYLLHRNPERDRDRLTPELAQDAYLLVTMGCGDECPFVPGLRRDDWPLPDPKGKALNR